MRVRSPGAPDEPPGEATGDAMSDAIVAGPVSFGVPAGVTVAKFATAVVVALATLLARNQPQVVVGWLAAAAVAVYAVRDLVARERLRADPEGVVVVRGYAGRRRLAWTDLEGVRVDARTRFGARTELLELDAGEEIFLLSRFDLGVDPDDALRALDQVRNRP